MKKKSEIRLYRFEGTHEEIGRLQGSECRDILRGTHRMMASFEEIEILKPAWLPVSIFLWLGKQKAWMEYADAIERNAPRQFERMRGIASGSGEDLKYIALLHSMEVEMAKSSFTLQACSAAAVTAERSATGEPVIIKNFDYPRAFMPIDITRLDAPKNGYRVLGVTSAPLAGTHDSMNEHGLSIAYNYGYGQDERKGRVPLTIALQETLERCKTTAEAVEFMRGFKYGGSALWIVCDAQGDLRALEITNSMIEERRPVNGVLFHTNHYLTPRAASVDVPPNAYYSDRTVKALRGHRCRESSEARFDRCRALFDNVGKATRQDLISIFSDHGADGVKSDNTICRHSDYFCTTMSVLMYPARKKIEVLYGNPCEFEFQEMTF
jgi:isopenicillin-N N-acyltransferase like protein